MVDHNLTVIQNFRHAINVTCWHMNETESDAMWQLYMPSGQGVAIRSTFSRFRDAFNSSSKTVHGGMVKYVDYETHEVDHGNLYNWSILKRHSFAHENEFRGFVTEPPENQHGVAATIETSTLIETVFVAPTAPSWHAELLRSLLATHGLDISVQQSTLYNSPTYFSPPTEPPTSDDA